MYKKLLNIIFAILLVSQVDYITGKLIGEGGRLSDDALIYLSCTVKNRIAVGWNINSVMDHYYAPYIKPTEKEINIVNKILQFKYNCLNVYFAYSDNDVINIGIDNFIPQLRVCNADERCINFYQRWFRKVN